MKKKEEKVVEKITIYKVKLGTYKLERNAKFKMKNIAEKTKMDCAIEMVDGRFVVYSKTLYKTLSNAKKRVASLKEKYKIESAIEEVNA